MKVERSKVVLSSGRKFDANDGILGMSNAMELTEGYDGRVYDEREFTPDERKEIADHMIGLWQRWATLI